MSISNYAQSSLKTVVAQFQGYSQGTYGFIDENEDFLEFEECDPEVLEMYELKTKEHIDEYFQITYATSVNEDGDTIWILKEALLEEDEEEEIDY